MSRIGAVVVVCAALGAVPAFGASPDPKDLVVPQQELSKARELIRRLGSEVYRDREDAQAELIKMGRLARGPLAEAAAGDADPEVRQRAARLLPKASAADLQARIDTFLADGEGKFEHDLPGLKTFRAHVAGANDKARALYVDILKSPHNMEMFAAMDRGHADGGRAISDRRSTMWNELQNRGQFGGQFGGKPFVPKQPTLPDVAALLFAETMVPSEHIPKTAIWGWVNGAQFVQQTASMQALNGSAVPHAEAYKGIVAQWLITRVDPTELANLSYQLGNGGLRQFKESQLLLRRILLTDGVQGYAKGQALNSLLNNRAKEELPLLRAIMKNQVRLGDYPGVLPGKKDPDEVISMNNDQMITQVWFGKPNGQAEMHSCLLKDVALAYLITIGGGNIKEYAFEMPQGVVVNPNQLGYGQYAFTSEVARNTGFMKYAWKQLKDGIDPKPKDEPKPPAPAPSK